MMNDIEYMRLALKLAASMSGRTSPDPMVGAVIVKGGKIVGKGTHAEAGTPHAEALALKIAGKRAKGAAIYLNLEPCCHFGNNPPCADSLISAGIKRVVASMVDPNPLVSGRGIKKLKSAGIKVDIGLLAEEAIELNEFFIKYISKKRPFVILKSAMSLDGKIAAKDSSSKWITGERSRKMVHKIRGEVDAIMTGIGTVLADDPRLNVRMAAKKKKNPLKIVIDPLCKIPAGSKILKNEPCKAIVVVLDNANKTRINKIESLGATVIRMKGRRGKIDLNVLMDLLGKIGVMSIMVEAGGGLAASAIEAKIVDRAMFFVSPKIIGGKSSPGPVGGDGIENISKAIKAKDIKCSKVGEDILIVARLS